jgi:hypothetical protein
MLLIARNIRNPLYKQATSYEQNAAFFVCSDIARTVQGMFSK